MKIQIIGLGIVGTAQAHLSDIFGNNTFGCDPKFETHPYCEINEEYKMDTDITFICTLEHVVEDIIKNLVDIKYTGAIVVKSTVAIGTIKRLSEKYNVHICHNPEFLLEETNLEDVIEPNMTVIGQCCKEHGDIIEEFYKPLNKSIFRVNYTTSELIKLSLNAHLSTLITFWNEIDELSTKLGVDTAIVSNIIGHDPRISQYGRRFFGEPYGGKCLPKDMKHLIRGFHSNDLNPKLFDACEKFNENIKH